MKLNGTGSAGTATTDAAEPVRIPGVNYLEINVNGKGFERGLLWQLSYWNIAYVPISAQFQLEF